METGKTDIEASRFLDLSPFGRSATFAGIDLLQYNKYRPQITQNALASIVRLFVDGRIKPVYPITPYSITDMEKAMRQMQSGLHMGKLVLVPGAHDKVKVFTRPRPLGLDDPNSTYVLTGGLGGVGRAIALWMIEKGAKNIAIVSRNAESHPQGPSLVQFAEEKGCKVYIRNVDISDEKSLLEFLSHAACTIPPIKGVIQGAMILEVCHPSDTNKLDSC